MGAMQKTITPIDGSLYVERPYNSAAEIAAALAAALAAAKAWRACAGRRARPAAEQGGRCLRRPQGRRSPRRSPARSAGRWANRPARSAASRSAPAT